MLKITPQQFDVFQQQAELQFAEELQQTFREKYPHLFFRFPDEIQLKIVTNMLDRGRRWGISWKSSLTIFAELMVAFASNFDEQTEIKKTLENNLDQINLTIKTMLEDVPDAAWAQAEANAEDLPLFLSAAVLDAPLVEQTASAIPLVLWDQVSELDFEQYAVNACRYAGELGLSALQDAPLTLIVCRRLYGSEFNQVEKHPWVKDLLECRRHPRERLAMLKYRIALDHGRMV